MGSTSSSTHPSSSNRMPVQPCQEAKEGADQEDFLPEQPRKTIFDGVTLPPGEPYQTVDEFIRSKNGILKPGDPIEIEDKVLRHWALYAGEAEEKSGAKVPMVIHLFGLNGMPHEVRYDPLLVAADGKKCRVNFKYDKVLQPRTSAEIMKAAHEMLGSKKYHIMNYNCEHFVTGCRYGFFVSEQVQEAQNSYSKQFEIARAVVSNGFSTATYTLKGLLPFQK